MTTHLHANTQVHSMEAARFRELHPELYSREETEIIEKALQAIRICSTRGKGIRVLDIAAGTGRLTIPLLQAGFSVTAIDQSHDMLASLQSNRDHVSEQNLTIKKSDAETFLTTSNDLFDVIIMGAFLHHVIDIPGLLSLCVKRLVAGGLLIVVHDPALRSRQALRYGRLFERFDSVLFQIGYLFRHGKVIPRMRDYAEAEIHTKKGIDDQGLIDILKKKDCSLVEHQRYFTHKTRVCTALDRNWLHLLPQFYFVVQKKQ